MSVNDITLSGGMRSNLVNLQLTSALQARSSERLATGKRVNSAIDDPTAFFAAQSYTNRANDLSTRKDAMGEAIQTIKAANDGVTGITALIEQAKGVLSAARSASTTDRATLATQFDDIMSQIDTLAGDSSYKGTNLLKSGTLSVSFNEDGSSSLDVTGFDATSTGLGIAAAANSFAGDADITAASDDLDTALSSLRTNAASLSANSGVITTRQDFTTNLINTLTEGADKLTAADPNEESANMLALQTRQQLGVASLSMTSQAQQSILRLFP
jgi:flagellin